MDVTMGTPKFISKTMVLMAQVQGKTGCISACEQLVLHRAMMEILGYAIWCPDPYCLTYPGGPLHPPTLAMCMCPVQLQDYQGPRGSVNSLPQAMILGGGLTLEILEHISPN
jgi:hypothetical protein